MIHRDLIHFPKAQDPPSKTEKESQSDLIEKQTAEFLANKDNKIDEVDDHKRNAGFNTPIRRTRRAQINHLRRMDNNRAKKPE